MTHNVKYGILDRMGAKGSFQHPRYKLMRLLGAGGMGKVYLARDLLEGGRRVALKVYPARYHDERLRREFLALRELHHPAIARALHFGTSEPDGAPFFTMEYVEGEPLDRHLDGLRDAGGEASGLSVRTCAAVWTCTAVAAAVAYLHRRGVLHLDIKPSNILVVDVGPDAPPQPILIDFGLVHAVTSERDPVGHGTLPFMPPEFFLGRPPTPASDVYSLAATFYRVLSGRYPVVGEDVESYARAHKRAAAQPIPEVPPALERLLLRALAKDPVQRFKDAGELHKALLSPEVSALAGELRRKAPVVFHEPDFVGRARELAIFKRWLEGDRRKAPVFLVRGGGGWGKTRFLEKAGTLVEVEGKKTLAIQCAEGERFPFLEACDRSLSLLRVPGAGAGFGKQGSRKGLSPLPSSEDARVWARRTALRMLPFLLEDTFLLVDDFHFSDPVERWALEQLSTNMLHAKVPAGGGIILAWRRTEGGESAGGPWKDAGWVASADLGPLSLDEALRIDLEGLDGALAGISPEKALKLKSELHQEVGGHPLFYVRGLLDLAGEAAAATKLAPTDRVMAHVARLAEGERKVAACLACLGRAAGAEELAAVLSTEVRSVLQVFQRLKRAGLLAVSERSARVIHESVRQAIQQSLSHGERASIHERIASALSGARGGSQLAEASWHLFEAGRSAEALRLASRWIGEGLHFSAPSGSKAVDLLLRAVDAAGRRTPEALEYLEAAAEVLERLGRYEECFARLEELVGKGLPGSERPTSADDVRRRRKLGSVAHRIGRVELSLSQLLLCVTPEAERDAPTESLQARAELALLHHFRGDVDLAVEHASRGVAMWKARSRQDQRATLQSAINLHATLGQIHIRRLEFQKSIACLRQGLQLAERMRSKPNIAVLLNNLGLAFHLAGRLAVALGVFRRAEKIAKELEDFSAIVSIHSNIAQILAKRGSLRAAKEMLDEIEGSPAVRQSKRLQVGCLYTRGLLFNLARVEAEELWAEVEGLAVEVNDLFLARLARIYRAEGQIFKAAYSSARGLLEAGPEGGGADALVGALCASRRSYLEALAGRGELAREIRQALVQVSPATPEQLPAIPDQLLAWNELYRGASALETGDWEESLRALEAARKIFRKMGFAAGEVECALFLADLCLRAPGAVPRAVERASREIQAARAVSMDSFGDLSPRSRDLRSALLEARLLLAKILRAPSLRGPSLREPSPGARDIRGALSDLLARAAGDPGLSSDPQLKLLAELLLTAGASALGDRTGVLKAEERLSAARADLARRLDPSDADAALRRDPWERYELAAFRPPREPREMEARHAEALAAVLDVLEGSDADRLRHALATVGRAIPARRVDLLRGEETLAIWEESPPQDGLPRAAEGQRLFAPLKKGVPGAGMLRACSRGADRFSFADAAFLDAAALLLAREFGSIERLQPPSPEGVKRQATLPLAPMGAEARDSSRGDSALSETHTVAVRVPGTAAISQFLKNEGFIVAGQALRRIIKAIRLYASSDLPVLITGESGTGKNLVAQALHKMSPRRDGPFVVQSASAVPADIFEADLFGYERGAFTGAEQTRTGFLFSAQGGTFHLEEIGDLGPQVQQLLLKVIEEKIVRPIGATRSRPIDVRFVVSTHRDIDAMVRRSQFRSDLFFRLNVARIHLPPLREMRDAIPQLVAHYWRELTGQSRRIPPAVLSVLEAHDWPGNVRELISVLRRLSLEGEGFPGPGDVRAALGGRESPSPFSPDLFRSRTFEDVQSALEQSYLRHLYEKHQGSLEEIAKALGTTTRSVYRRFERLGIKPRTWSRGKALEDRSK